MRPGESFAFRLHKRGEHRHRQPTPNLEAEVGGQIADALARRDGRPPRVDLTRPDVVVNAEVLGLTTLVGVARRRWWGPPETATTPLDSDQAEGT